MSLSKSVRTLHKRIRWYVAAKVLLSLIFLAYAGSLSVSTSEFQAENGGSIAFTDNLTAADKGISLVPSPAPVSGASCASNVTFASGSPRTANTNLTANHYMYTIQVNTTGSTVALSCFTVTFTIIASGISSNPSILYLAANATAPVPANQTINCEFDIGATLPPSPYSFSVAVKKVP